jgi:SAM-dependent methyltransferase
MDNQEIINSLNKYQKQQFGTKYLNSCINYFKKLNNPIKNLSNDNEKLLTGVKINLFYNIQKYYCYFSNQEIDDVMCVRKLNLSKKGLSNLINQIQGIETNNLKICQNLKSNQEIYYYINDEPIKKIKDDEIPKKKFYEINSIFLGIQSFYFLEHQNLDNYCSDNIINNSKKLFNEIYDYLDIYKKLSWEEKDRLVIFSGLVYHFLGALYTQDIDMIYLSNNDNNYQKYFDIFKNFDFPVIVMKDRVIKTQNDKSSHYFKNWIKFELPQLADIENIYTLILNPKFHFHFLGMKCFDITASSRRLISRSTALSFIDIFLLKKFTNIDFLKEFCLKNISIRQGTGYITNDDLTPLYNKIINLLKKWYDIDLNLDFVKKHLIKCDKMSSTIYSNYKKVTNSDNKKIFNFNREVTKKYIMQYSKNTKSILDIGIGRCLGIYTYAEAGIKNIFGIEPSIYSINRCENVIKALKDSNIKIFHGFGEEKFNQKEILSQKFETVILTFSIHYMIDKIDTLIDNINKVTKKGSIIMIYCLNGKMIYNKIKKGDRYEIKYKNEPHWGVYKYNDPIPKAYNKDFKMLFYFKDVYGVKNGSEEYLVNIDNLIKKMKGYKLEVNNSFLQELKNMDNIKHDINLDYQEKILELHQVLIFRKI